MEKEEEIRIKNHKAEEAMRRAKKAQKANEKMQRELQAAARELAKHQELAKKASMQKAAAQEAAVSRKSVKSSTQSQQQEKSAAALKQQEASREAARQAMIYEAAKRRAEKKEAARKAAELIAAQREAEKKIHHTSPETRELQNLLLQQISDIMEERPEDAGEAVEPEQKGRKTGEVPKAEQTKILRKQTSGKKKPVDTKQLDSGVVQDFGDLVIMDVHGGELQPESSAVLENNRQVQRAVQESEKMEEKLESWGRMGTWFQTFCWMHIPIVGFWYMVMIACRRKTPKEKKAFARAYILYRVLVLILAGTLLYIFYRMGLSFFEQILSYIEAHQ